jgi:hypothetical protein
MRHATFFANNRIPGLVFAIGGLRPICFIEDRSMGFSSGVEL